MSERRQIIRSGRGFFSDIVLKIRLTIELLKDKRVDFWLKMIPILCLFYLIMPLDLLIGPIDDAVVLYIGMDFFIELCPEDVVNEHLKKIQHSKSDSNSASVVDVEFKNENKPYKDNF